LQNLRWCTSGTLLLFLSVYGSLLFKTVWWFDLAKTLIEALSIRSGDEDERIWSTRWVYLLSGLATATSLDVADLCMDKRTFAIQMENRDSNIKGVFAHTYWHPGIEHSVNRCVAVFLWDGMGDPGKLWEEWMSRMDFTLISKRHLDTVVAGL
jgi:hypothetical protein